MPVDGTDLAAPLLLAAWVTTVVLFLRSGRRRRQRLGEAVHELRRPLQVLALRLERGVEPGGGEDLLRQATIALAEIEAGIHGEPPPRSGATAPVLLESLGEQARRRWQGTVELEFEGDAGDAWIEGDSERLAAALDNLIANAAEHGTDGIVALRADRGVDDLRLVVANGGVPDRAAAGARPLARRAGHPRGRGFGLGIAARIAAENGGALSAPRAVGSRTETALRLPRGR